MVLLKFVWVKMARLARIEFPPSLEGAKRKQEKVRWVSGGQGAANARPGMAGLDFAQSMESVLREVFPAERAYTILVRPGRE